MYTSLITNAEKATLQEDGSMFIDVEFVLKKDDEVIDTKKLAFPLGTLSEEILAEVEKYTANYAAEENLREKNAERDAEYAVADNTIDEIIGQEITGQEIITE